MTTAVSGAFGSLSTTALIGTRPVGRYGMGRKVRMGPSADLGERDCRGQLEALAALTARELIDDGVNVHPGEKIGYVITNAKAKNKAERVNTSSRNGLVQYDRQEYAARLKVAAKEVGVIGDNNSSDERGRAGANRLPLFPD